MTNSGCILRIEPTGFAGNLIWSIRDREASWKDPGIHDFQPEQLERYSFHQMMGKAAGAEVVSGKIRNLLLAMLSLTYHLGN